MRTIDFLAVAASAMILVSCGENSPFVKRSALEQSLNESAELRSSLQNLQESFAKQNEELASILSDLSSVSQRTAVLQLNVENTIAQPDTVMMIHENIDAIKQRIDKLEKEANRARKLDKSLAVATKTISELRATVSLQENKIVELQELVKAKDSTIKMQSSTISSQSDKINAQNKTIASQEEELKKTVAEQVEIIYQAGAELESIADNGDFKVIGRKDKTAIKDYRKKIYERAASYYEMAAGQGSEAAAKALPGLRTKIDALNQ